MLQTIETTQAPRNTKFTNSNPSPNVEFCLVDSLDEFASLSTEWEAFFSEHAKPHQLFQSHTWLQNWCLAYRQSLQSSTQNLSVVVARRQGRISLILPLLVTRSAGVKSLQWMGLPASQYGDVLVEDHSSSQDLVLQALEFAIRETGADLLWLRKVRDDAVISPALRQFGATSVSECAAPFVDLSSCTNTDDYMRRFSSNARKQRRRRRRRLDELGKIAFTWHQPGEAAATAAIEALRLKRDTFGQASRLTAMDDCLQHFFAKVCAEGAGPIKPVVSVLTLDDKALAYEIGLVYGGYYAAHVGVFDPNFAQHGPGTLQMDETVSACIRHGIQTYDLLAPADSYKLSFANDTIRVCDYALGVTSLGKLYKRSLIDLGMPLLKQLRNKTVRLMRN